MKNFIAFILTALVFCGSGQTISAQTDNVSPLRSSEKIEKQLAGGATEVFRLEAARNQAFSIAVEQREIDVAVAVYDANGEKLDETDFSLGAVGTERLFFIADKSEHYRIEVRSLVKNAKPGSFLIELVEQREATERDRRDRFARQKFYAGNIALKKAASESYREALKNFDEAIAIWRETGNERGAAQTLYLKIDAYFNTGEMKSALASAETSLPLWRKVGDRVFEAETLYSIGVINSALGEREKADEFLRQSLALFRELKIPMGEGKVFSEIGFAFYTRGEYRKALQMFEQSLPLRREAHDLSGTSGALMAIGVCYQFLGEPDKSIEYFEKALPVAAEAGDTNLQASILSNLADAQRDMGDFDGAFESSRKSLELMRKTGNRYAESGTLAQYGDLYRHVGDFDRALPLEQLALELARATSRTEVEPLALHSLGLIYREKGDLEKSNQSFQSALEISRKMKNDYYIASQLNELAFNSITQKRFDEALTTASEANALFRKTGFAGGEAASLRNIGLAHHRKGDLTRALENYRQLLALAERIRHRVFKANAHYYIALNSRDAGDLRAALASIEKAVAIFEQTRSGLTRKDFRASFLAGNRQIYELYIDILLRLGETEKQPGYVARALEISERARARTLVELLGEAGAGIREGANPELLEKERVLARRLSVKAERQTKLLAGEKVPVAEIEALAKEIADLTDEAAKVAAEIRRTSPRYSALVEPAPISVKEIQHLLDSETVLLEYALGEENNFFWLVTNDSVSVYKLPEREKLEQSARDFYAALTARNAVRSNETRIEREARIGKADQDSIRAGEELKQILFGEIGEKLKNKKRIVVAAEGALQYVPFAALAPEFEIVNVPSASTLNVLHGEIAGRKAAPKTIAVFADPVFSPQDPRVKTALAKRQTDAKQLAVRSDSDGENLWRAFEETSDGGALKTIPRLPFSRREAEAILQSVAANQSLKAIDFAANSATATGSELANYKIVHFATHGFLNSRQPELSGLVLSLVDEKGEAENGFLRLNDIYNLRLNAELVVLSACQTALGRDIKGEGLVGLTRGFMYAGAPRVVASLWKVDDAATAELMKRFYAGILVKKLRPAEALRAAQLEMSRDERFKSPYFWAAFTLQGEWK